jgi:hypothetical protein
MPPRRFQAKDESRIGCDFFVWFLLVPEAIALRNVDGRKPITAEDETGEEMLSLVSLSTDDISDRVGWIVCFSMCTLSVNAPGIVEGDRDDCLRNGTRDRDTAVSEEDPVKGSFAEETVGRFGTGGMSALDGANFGALLGASAAAAAIDGALLTATSFVVVSPI